MVSTAISYQTPLRNNVNASPYGTPPQNDSPFSPRNDDAAERKARRKSAMLRQKNSLMTPMRSRNSWRASKSSTPGSGFPATPGGYAIQMPTLSPEELNQRYEEWMKIAADNKINMNNTWDFALIDYFYDMNLLKDGDSINFQKASCTLDGCVKIYSSRVDSVASEAGKLLNGLAEAPKKGQVEGNDYDEDGEEGRKSRKKPVRTTNTLAKDDSQINIKKFDLEFSVDPLFKKASADFDEGGASGLLLNHLAMDKSGKIVFDASDSKTDEEEEVENEVPELPLKVIPFDPENLRPHLETINEKLDSLDLCPSLANFRFSNDSSIDFLAIKESLGDDVLNDTEPAADANGSTDFFTGGDDDDDDLMDDNMDAFMGQDDGGLEPQPLQDPFSFQVTGSDGDGEINEFREMQATNATGPAAFSFQPIGGSNDILSYFDTKTIKSWAGPEHWKMPLPKSSTQSSVPDQKRKKQEKQPFFIDFIEGEEPNEDVIFALPPRKTAILMNKNASKGDSFTLPKDTHYSSKNLFNLFLKPKMRFQVRSTNSSSTNSQSEGHPAEFGGFQMEGEEDALHLSQEKDLSGIMEDDDENDFFDDPIGPSDGDIQNATSSAIGSGGNIESMPELKLIKPLYVNYARRAKRVNVKKLKDNLWHGLSGTKDEASKTTPDEQGDANNESEAAQDSMKGEQKFSELVGGLKDMYPKEKLSEISVPFCFICLLHLANEKGLTIENEEALGDLIIRQNSLT
ncbi:hypothetical protein H4219_003619 [Mycoemilia scoparia]|uniref:Condensin complex subunit 2 n=1 Tax=Mycoemilia scoparia TaxID=417184 RepID=A0A9W7ZUA3_9FUNG|nr:hypothetical protein H4219_003619 [Mycoemilia scoparia]